MKKEREKRNEKKKAVFCRIAAHTKSFSVCPFQKREKESKPSEGHKKGISYSL